MMPKKVTLMPAFSGPAGEILPDAETGGETEGEDASGSHP